MVYDDDIDPEGPSADDVARFAGDDAEHGLFCPAPATPTPRRGLSG